MPSIWWNLYSCRKIPKSEIFLDFYHITNTTNLKLNIYKDVNIYIDLPEDATLLFMISQVISVVPEVSECFSTLFTMMFSSKLIQAALMSLGRGWYYFPPYLFFPHI